ncbi:hypothetical protein M427DRAFT_462037 [Gonapodya prolifera JEL478]|uniref:C3H1-type domain-containing protein n=1 Tax=Gonapodya prolifera (strain JEL478) TaxID=1344416 RepID=A0A139A241_GONPJ|nr:hypothetical protein M427DRAFT_462037 [Gonapodya prolifera JEL478]|eukprot:KXS10811.1 hypothetical protein M427DRAFT_462037 [Gonapodya prolifera JEL478]
MSSVVINEVGQTKLQEAVQLKLQELGIENDVLAQFVAVMVCNGKSRQQVEEELGTIVGDEMDVSGFCGWLFANVSTILAGIEGFVKTEDVETGQQTVSFTGFDQTAPIPVEMSDSRSGPRRLRQNRLLDIAIESAARDTGAGASAFGAIGSGPVGYHPSSRPGARLSPPGGNGQGVISWEDDGSEMVTDAEFPIPGSGPIRGRPQPARAGQPYPQPLAAGAAKQPIKTPGPPPPPNPLPRQDLGQLVSEPATTFTVTLNGQVIEERVESKPVRCGYWPQCKKGAECRFWHPVELCPQWPNCPYNDAQCLYIHPSRTSIQRQNQPGAPPTAPAVAKRVAAAAATFQTPRVFPNKTLNNTTPAAPVPGGAPSPATSGATAGGVIPSLTMQDCHYAANCTRADCKFYHPSPSAIVLPRAGLGRIAPTDPRRAARCKFYPLCENPDCGFYHPSPAAAAARVNGAAAATSSADDAMMADAEGDAGLGASGSSAGALAGARSPQNGKIPVPCKFLPFCTKPNCPFEHRAELVAALEAGKRADRKFAANEVEEKVPVPKSEGEDTVMA